jgi:predicted amidophosphoribosyltransferase
MKSIKVVMKPYTATQYNETFTLYKPCCPKCGKPIEPDYEQPKYCKECGQKLDWSKD